MKRFQIRNISTIPFEGTHELPNSRQTLVTKEDVISNNIDAFTKGTLKSGKKWDWHKHEEYDEICIVLQGRGKFYWEDEIVNYSQDDVIIIPANSKHKFEAEGDVDNSYYFVRIK